MLKIVTHNGSFHADDVFACAVLKLLYSDAEIIRTRNQSIIDTADIVVDVGQSYDSITNRYDHHQKGGAGVHQHTGIKMSSIGLVWERYGLQLIYNLSNEFIQAPEEGITFGQIWERVNWNLIQIIDAGDTGTKIFESVYDGVQPYTISQVISGFNPDWEEVQRSGTSLFDQCFIKAIEFAKTILINEIRSARSVIIARSKVLSYINKAQQEQSRVIVFDQHLPWMGTVIKNTYDELYVVYPSENEDWRIQCIPITPGSFDKRKALPLSWAGADSEQLNRLININDAVFAHTARFIAGAKSFKSIMRMAELAIEE
ncbi:MAG: MYG1 family protein [Proteobacteria bacterium]|nr:MYG1 family protein [Pseudomonadota bacterium]